VVSESIHDFFLGSAGVAGALIGLLFVAISVAGDRLSRAEHEGQLHRIRAVAALTAFTNALAVSLFALIPGHKIGPSALAVAVGGLGFVVAALLSLARKRRGQGRRGAWRDFVFLLGLIIVFAVQLIQAIKVIAHPDNAGAVNAIAVLVVVCFLIGVARAWELIGGPSIGITGELVALVKDHRDDPEAGAGAEAAGGADGPDGGEPSSP
jgi:hypothetical protein